MTEGDLAQEKGTTRNALKYQICLESVFGTMADKSAAIETL